MDTKALIQESIDELNAERVRVFKTAIKERIACIAHAQKTIAEQLAKIVDIQRDIKAMTLSEIDPATVVPS